MSGFANRLKSMGDNNGGNQMAPMESFAITVTGYDNVTAEKEQDRFVIGKRVDTGEEVRVSLRPPRAGATLKGERSGIQKFADYETFQNLTAEQRKKLGVKPTCAAPGGEIRFDGAYPLKGQPNVYSARWGVVTAHFPGEARSVREWFRVRPPKISYRTDGLVDRATVALEVLKTKQAAIVSSFDEFKAKLADALTPRNPGNPMVFAVVRIAAGDTVVSLEARAQRDETKKDAFVYLPVEQSIQRFLDVQTRLGKVGEVVGEALTDGDAKVEVIGGTCFNMGKMAVAALIQKNAIGNVDELHRIDPNPERPINGFIEGWVTLRVLEGGADKGLVVSHTGSTVPRDQIVPLLPRDIPTANIVPPAPVRNAAPAAPTNGGEAAPAPAAAAPAAAGAGEAPAAAGVRDDVDDLNAAMASYEGQDAQKAQPARKPASMEF